MNEEKKCPDLGHTGQRSKLTIKAQERAVTVLADPSVLKRAGPAAPLLAVVNERCGDGDICRLKYADVAKELDVSVTTAKGWAEALEELGYFTRKPCGPAGVDIRLCLKCWPCEGVGTALQATSKRLVDVLGALRLTVDGTLASTITDVQRVLEAA